VMNVIGDIEGKDAVMVDDIIDTGGTIVNAATILKEMGAKRVFGCATHGVLSGPAVDRICDSVIEKFIITDTIPLKKKCEDDKIEVVSVAPLFAEAIQRINENRSVSVIFD
ncbi:MAG TPA: ribose-phosphate diphosphokinase, partial [Tissierellaceae bacterium]|nr:ribose-phosphate diphosphokinase [Tissierellaceae bacterium]